MLLQHDAGAWPGGLLGERSPIIEEVVGLRLPSFPRRAIERVRDAETSGPVAQIVPSKLRLASPRPLRTPAVAGAARSGRCARRLGIGIVQLSSGA
jgi:hypothetical protein